MIVVLFIALALASNPPEMPAEPEPVENQCDDARPLSFGTPVGEAFPDVNWSVEDGPVLACSGVLVPTSRVARLLQYEEHAKLLSQRYKLDTELLEMRIQALERPQPWLKRPQGQRWVGRIEATLIVGAIAAAIVVTTVKLNEN